MAGHFGNSCGNCKWRDHAARCRPRDDNESDNDAGSGDDRDPPPPRQPRRPIRLGAPVRRGLLLGSEDNPIEL